MHFARAKPASENREFILSRTRQRGRKCQDIADREAIDGHLETYSAMRAAMGEQVGDVDAECAHDVTARSFAISEGTDPHRVRFRPVAHMTVRT